MSDQLDYASAPKPRKHPCWLILFAAWVASAPAVRVLDQAMKGYLYGGAADGGATILAMMFGILLGLIVASFFKRSWWIAAILGGACGPVTVVAIYLLWR